MTFKSATASFAFVLLTATSAYANEGPPKLTVFRMFGDATPVVKLVLAGLLLTSLAALVIMGLGLAKPVGERPARFLKGAMVAAPIAALFGSAYGVLNIFIGIANTNVVNLAVAAPGIAEAILSVTLGLLALLLSAIAYGVVGGKAARAA